MRHFLHIWRADLTASYPGWPAAEAALSPAEQARLARLRPPLLRQTYARAHGFLRAILGRYTGLPGAAVELQAAGNGKPVIANSTVHFNLSYRPGRALLAVTNRGPVGADIEPLTPLADAAALVKELFSGPEQAALHAAAPGDYWPLFYLIWTRKEAYAKAQGMGLAFPFADFSVLAPGTPPRPASPADAQILSFAAGAGWQGSVAILGTAPVTAQHVDYPADEGRLIPAWPRQAPPSWQPHGGSASSKPILRQCCPRSPIFCAPCSTLVR